MTENIKLVVVGDKGAGKTCLLISWCNNSFPDDYVPTVFLSHSDSTFMFGTHFSIGYWDMAGQEEFDRLRKEIYPGTNVFLVCFDLTNRESFERVRTKWKPEFEKHASGIPIVLCGTKSDLRSSLPCISTGEGMKMATNLGAVSYVETSAKTRKNLRLLFRDCVISVIIGKGKFQYYIPESDRFSAKRVREKVTISSVEEFKKYNFGKCMMTFKKVKKMILSTQKKVKSAKKHLAKLSDDLIFYIFHHFYLFDYPTSCYFYRSEYMFYKEELASLNLNFDQDVFFQCFGYFSRDKGLEVKKKRVFQLFYNFQVRSDHEIQMLPKLKKCLIFYYPKLIIESPIIIFEDYMNLEIFSNKSNRNIHIKELRNITFPNDWEFWSKYLENDSEKQTLRKLQLTITNNRIQQQQFDFLSTINKQHLLSLSLHRTRPVIEEMRVCRYDQNEIKIPSLQNLVLDRYVMNKDLTFSNCISLQDITFIGSLQQFPLELSFGKEQFFDLLHLQELRKIRFLFYNLVDIEAHLHKLLSEYSGQYLEEIILHRCLFSYQHLETCNFRNLKSLKLLVITHYHLRKEVRDLQNEFPRDFLIRIGEKTKDFQFLLRSSQKGAFSNMKQKVKIKVIQEIEKFIVKQKKVL